MIQVQNLSSSMPGKFFSKGHFSLGLVKKLAEVGRNGTGKTTLIKILRGLENYDGEKLQSAQLSNRLTTYSF